MRAELKDTLGFMLFLFLFVIGANLYFKGPWPWSLGGSIMVGIWVGWVYERRSKTAPAPTVTQELTIFCPRCATECKHVGTGFRLDGTKFSPDPKGLELKVVESNFHLYNCATCRRSTWVQLVVVSNPISITVGSPPAEKQ